MSDITKEEKALQKVKEEIEKIGKKENNVFFFVLDTKGVPSGSLAYIYELAYIVKQIGYNVGLLHQTEKDEEFVGVESWLGEKYSSLPHYNIAGGDVEIMASDVLFIPDIFASVMNQTKKLPCKRIALLQNYNYLVEQMPFAAQWGDFGIMEALTNTEYNAELLKDIFPYVKTTVVEPFVDKIFGEVNSPKNMVVNIVASDQSDINKIIKPFYWKFPSFKWVSFKDLRGFSRENFASALREAPITIWVDDDSSFGYSALEAMKSGNIVIAKIPNNHLSWAYETDKDGNERLRNNCIWFDDIKNVQRMIASAVRSWITDAVPSAIYEESKKTAEPYTYDKFEKSFTDYITSVIDRRKEEMIELVRNVENNLSKKKEA